MTYEFARINLDLTDYNEVVDWAYLDKTKDQIDFCQLIYHQYCAYKKFSSVMPLFAARLQETTADLLGYFDQGDMVAFSLIRRFDNENALCDQFAWTYHDPSLRLGIETMKTECAIYKRRGFRYLYLEQAHSYKKEISGFEILGPLA